MKPDNGSRFWTHLQMRNELNAGFAFLTPNNQALASYGQNDLWTKQLYSSIKLHKQFTYEFESQSPSADQRLPSPSSSSLPARFNYNQFNQSDQFHGGIFNLTFSDDGNLLAAACERKSMLMFDARTQSLQSKVNDAHEDSVNYIRFLDSRLFASCSDDCTIALWDLRNLKKRLRILNGHTHCVKNIEYDSSLGLLISSSFDGNVHLWDINKYNSGHLNSNDAQRSSAQLPFLRNARPNQDQCPYTKALYLSCLLRMRVTNDNTKMILCTSEGYLMIVHDLDLKYLESDLRGFQSDLYRLMQKGHSSGFDFGSWLNRLFTAKRNRVELISDFPIENEAHSITSLDVHPQNWTVLSRNISRDENSEWTCVHNIQDYERPHELMSIELPKETIFPPHTNFQRNQLRPRLPVVGPIAPPSFFNNHSDSSDNQDNLENEIDNTSNANNEEDDHLNDNEVHVSPLIIISARTLNRRAHATILNPSTSFRQIKPDSIAPKIYCNLPRITSFIEELNVGPRFIKELCFSPCGRLICSPYEFGFRLLSFDSHCSELRDLAFDNSIKMPVPLTELNRTISHQNFVVTTRFSPTQCLIATGCLGGQVNFHQPVL